MKRILFLPLFLCIQLNVSAQFSAELYFGELSCEWDSILGDYCEVEIMLDSRSAYPCAGFQFDVSDILINSFYGGIIDSYNWMTFHNSSFGSSHAIDVTATGSTDYTFAGDFSGADPNISIELGDTLVFNVNTPGHPFWLKTLAGTGQGNAITVANNGTASDTIVWVPFAVGTYFYNCEFHSGMTGSITVSPHQADTSTVISFSFGSLYLPSALSVLTIMRFTNPNDSSYACLDNFIYSDSAANAVPTSVGACLELPPFIYADYEEICKGDSINIFGIYRDTAGTYDDSLIANNGCDSINRMNLIVNSNYVFNSSDIVYLCSGDSFMIGGVYYDTPGIYDDSLMTVKGCDSIIKTSLNINPVYEILDTSNICTGDSILLGAEYYTATGTYYDSMLTLKGCDSVFVHKLIIDAIYEILDSASICIGDSILLGSGYYSNTGVYFDSLQTAAGCDSVLIHDLFVNDLPVPSITQNGYVLTSSPGASYQWYQGNSMIISEIAQSYSAIVSGSYSVFVTDSNGCRGNSDTIDLTIVSVDDRNAESHILVLPNPFKDQAIIQFNNLASKGPYTIIVYNLIGEKIFEKTTMERQMLFKRNDLIQGIYFIELVEKSNRLVEKLIIK